MAATNTPKGGHQVSVSKLASLLVTSGMTLSLMSAASASTASSTTAVPSIGADRAAAQSINLTSTDLPGWQESPNPPNAAAQSANAKMVACIGVHGSGTRYVADVTSANFDKGQVEINSEAVTVRSHKEGLADMRSLKNPKAPTCFVKIVGSAINSALPKGVKASRWNVKISNAGSVPGAVEILVRTTISGKMQGSEISKHLTVEEIEFLVGRAEVSLNINQSGKTVDVPLEASLLHTLYMTSLAASTATDQ
jgi:hypothetical protein